MKRKRGSVSKIKEARATIRDTFKADAGLYQSYVANVAMLLHDRYGIMDPVTYDAAARDVLQLIFDIERGNW